MPRIDFYHLKKQSLEEVLPRLLEKAYTTGNAVLLKTTTDNVEKINTLLWTYADDGFLPHGSAKDGFAAEQPVFITDNDENVNQAHFLFLTNGAEPNLADIDRYDRIFNIFDENTDTAVQQARQLWKNFKDSGYEVHYWQQSERGNWEQKV